MEKFNTSLTYQRTTHYHPVRAFGKSIPDLKSGNIQALHSVPGAMRNNVKVARNNFGQWIVPKRTETTGITREIGKVYGKEFINQAAGTVAKNYLVKPVAEQVTQQISGNDKSSVSYKLVDNAIEKRLGKVVKKPIPYVTNMVKDDALDGGQKHMDWYDRGAMRRQFSTDQVNLPTMKNYIVNRVIDAQEIFK